LPEFLPISLKLAGDVGPLEPRLASFSADEN
jgi:hypothetical protein